MYFHVIHRNLYVIREHNKDKLKDYILYSLTKSNQRGYSRYYL